MPSYEKKWVPKNKDAKAIFEKWKSEVQDLLTICKKGETINSINNQLSEVLGEEIPYRKMGFEAIEYFFYQIDDIITCRRMQDDRRIFLFIRNIDGTASHIRNLVEHQANAKKRGNKAHPTMRNTYWIESYELIKYINKNRDNNFANRGAYSASNYRRRPPPRPPLAPRFAARGPYAVKPPMAPITPISSFGGSNVKRYNPRPFVNPSSTTFQGQAKPIYSRRNVESVYATRKPEDDRFRVEKEEKEERFRKRQEEQLRILEIAKVQEMNCNLEVTIKCQQEETTYLCDIKRTIAMKLAFLF